MEEQQTSTNKLEHLPVTLFSIVMGMTGLAIAWDQIDLIVYHFEVGRIIAFLASALFVFLLATYAVKFVNYRQRVIEEFRHPVRVNFFATISISILLLSIYWQGMDLFCRVLWIMGASLHLLVTVSVMNSWINHNHYQFQHINPGWFIPVVGNIIAPISGHYLGYSELSWFFFTIGLLFWLVLLTIVMHRLIFSDPLPPKLMPMLFILLAPPSIGFVSYHSLSGEFDVFARILYYAAVFIALLLASNLIRFIRLPFFVSSWAFSFPLAALTIATQRYALVAQNQAFEIVASALLLLLTVLIVWLLSKTLVAVKKGKICVPEQ